MESCSAPRESMRTKERKCAKTDTHKSTDYGSQYCTKKHTGRSHKDITSTIASYELC